MHRRPPGALHGQRVLDGRQVLPRPPPRRVKIAAEDRFPRDPLRGSPLKTKLKLKDSFPLQVALFKPEERKRADEQSDSFFYSVPRFVQYVDENFNRQLKNWYRKYLKNGDVVLDLCSAYDSHLPEMTFDNVVGHGMCGPELAANPRLNSYFVKDLNEDPMIPSSDGVYDHVLCCMGLQYLKFPEDVCYDVHRILKPGGRFLVSFTSHCFPEKTVTGWLERTLEERADLVTRLMKNAGFVSVEFVSRVPAPDCPDVVSDSVLNSCFDADMSCSFDHPGNDGPSSCATSGSFQEGDPFYGVVGSKPLKVELPSSTAVEQPSAMDCAPVQFGALKVLDGPLRMHVPYYQWQRAMQAYFSLCRWAISIGIPESAVWQLDDNETIESLKNKRDYMQGMIASFVSSGL